jgi:hypothetical protein
MKPDKSEKQKALDWWNSLKWQDGRTILDGHGYNRDILTVKDATQEPKIIIKLYNWIKSIAPKD